IIDNDIIMWEDFLKLNMLYLPIINETTTQIIKKAINGSLYLGRITRKVAGLYHAKTKNEKLTINISIRIANNALFL
ncbi:MAG: hypothetical protein B6I20_11215, partial [Bacteroidetes bacterium 4572_117]